jgi:hypothetical protein
VFEITEVEAVDDMPLGMVERRDDIGATDPQDILGCLCRIAQLLQPAHTFLDALPEEGMARNGGAKRIVRDSESSVGMFVFTRPQEGGRRQNGFEKEDDWLRDLRELPQDLAVAVEVEAAVRVNMQESGEVGTNNPRCNTRPVVSQRREFCQTGLNIHGTNDPKGVEKSPVHMFEY